MMFRQSLLVGWLLTLLALEGRSKPLMTGVSQDIAVTKWLTTKLFECPDFYMPKTEGKAVVDNTKTPTIKQAGNASVLVVLQKTMLTFKIHEFISIDICDKIDMHDITAAIEPLHQQILASGYLGISGDIGQTGFLVEVFKTLQKLEDKVHSVGNYLDTSAILADIQLMQHHLKALQIAQDMGLIQVEQELDDILDKIKDFIDSVMDLIDKVCDYLEGVKDDILDWIDDLPLEDIEKLFKFLHFWIHNVEIPCDGSGTIIICDETYNILDLIQCCIMG